MPCIRCGYNLKGLTIRGMCSECGLSVRTTLLAKIDPMAKELRPIRYPRLTAVGLIVWSAAGLLSALCVWALRIGDLVGSLHPLTGLRWAVVVFAAMSGVAAAVLVRPYPGLPRMYSILAAVGVLAYAPLCWVLARLHVSYDALAGAAYGAGAAITTHRILMRLGIVLLLIVILVALRLNARQLAARWLLMRVGAVDRQTILVLVGVLGLAAVGDGTVLAAAWFHGGVADSVRLVGGVLIQIGSVLFTIGLAGITVDSWRLWDVIAHPPVAIDDVLGEQPADAAASPALRSIR